MSDVKNLNTCVKLVTPESPGLSLAVTDQVCYNSGNNLTRLAGSTWTGEPLRKQRTWRSKQKGKCGLLFAVPFFIPKNQGVNVSEKKQQQVFVTIRMSRGLASWARVYGAQRNLSRSEVVRQALQSFKMKEKKGTREK